MEDKLVHFNFQSNQKTSLNTITHLASDHGEDHELKELQGSVDGSLCCNPEHKHLLTVVLQATEPGSCDPVPMSQAWQTTFPSFPMVSVALS